MGRSFTIPLSPYEPERNALGVWVGGWRAVGPFVSRYLLCSVQILAAAPEMSRFAPVSRPVVGRRAIRRLRTPSIPTLWQLVGVIHPGSVGGSVRWRPHRSRPDRALLTAARNTPA